jgi:uncharacterized protein
MASDEDRLFEFVRKGLSGIEMGGHAFDHTRRVYAIAMEIGRKLGANLRILGAAAILHDVGRSREEETGISHSRLSGEMSVDLLRENGYTEEEITGIVGAIRTHRFSEGIEPTSLEGRILSDADKLDAIGAIGVYRSIAYTSVDARDAEGFLKHAEDKLLKLRDLMYTDEARVIAESRHKVLEEFVNQLRAEMT